MQDPDIVPMHAAKSTLSQLVKRAAAGEVVYIGAYGRAEVKLVPVEGPVGPRRRFGALQGTLHLPQTLQTAAVADGAPT